MSAETLQRAGRVGVATPPVVACPACASAAVETLAPVDVAAQHLAYAQGDAAGAAALGACFGHGVVRYQVRRCSHCGLEFADPPVAPPPAWYAELYARLPLYPADRWEYGQVRMAVRAGDAVVDYGCGSGAFLRSLAGQAGRCVGFDFSRAACAQAAVDGLDVRPLDLDGDAGDAPAPSAAQHVTAFHVLEHLARPQVLFRFARQVAAPGARLWIAVPSDRRASRRHGEPDALDAPPHHLTRWTEAALRDIGRAHGWRLVSHAYEPLPTRLAVWETTRRLPHYRRWQTRWRPVNWAARRALAAAVWAGGGHRRHGTSGFSMLACYRLEDAA